MIKMEIFNEEIEIIIPESERKGYTPRKRVIKVSIKKNTYYRIYISDITPNTNIKLSFDKMVTSYKLLDNFFVAIKEKQDPESPYNIPLIIIETVMKKSEDRTWDFESIIENYKFLLFYKLYKIIEKSQVLQKRFEDQLLLRDKKFSYDNVVEYWHDLDYLVLEKGTFDDIIKEIRKLKVFLIINKYIEDPLRFPKIDEEFGKI